MRLFPHLQVRKTDVIPFKVFRHDPAKAVAAITAAMFAAGPRAPDGVSKAWLDWRDTPQSKIERTEMLDRMKRHDENFDKREAAAEILLLGSFPSYSASSTKTFNLTGTLPPGYEVRELNVIVEGTLATNATTGIAIQADYYIVAAALLNRLRASGFNVTDFHSLSPVESNALATYAKGRNVQAEFYRNGQPLTTTPIAVKWKFVIPFVNRNLEVPEIFSPSSDQLNLPGSKIDIDTNGTALTTLAIAGNAACTFVVTDVKAYAVGNVVPVLHAGPPHYQRSRQVAASIDSEYGAGLDQFLASEESIANGIARVSQWNVARDGREAPRNIDPWTLSQLYGEEIRAADGVLPFDFTQPLGQYPSGLTTASGGALAGSPGAQPGAQIIPLVWCGGLVREASAQWPFYLSSRTIRQNVIAGQSASFTLLYWQTKTIYEAAGQVVSLARANGLDVTSVDQLVVRGGYDGAANKLFKGRLLALPKSAPKTA